MNIIESVVSTIWAIIGLVVMALVTLIPFVILFELRYSASWNFSQEGRWWSYRHKGSWPILVAVGCVIPTLIVAGLLGGEWWSFLVGFAVSTALSMAVLEADRKKAVSRVVNEGFKPLTAEDRRLLFGQS